MMDEIEVREQLASFKRCRKSARDDITEDRYWRGAITALNAVLQE